MIVDCGIYVDGVRDETTHSVGDALDAARRRGGYVWIGLFEPTEDEFESVAEAFALHPLAVEDAIHAQQRPKLERYGDTIFVVFRPARYVDPDEIVALSQLMVFVGDDFVVTVRHGESKVVAQARRELELDPERARWGPGAVLHELADKVVDDYGAVMGSLDVDVDEIEDEVFTGPSSTHAERIFRLKREVLDFRRAVEPLEPALLALATGRERVGAARAEYFRDVHDHVLRVCEHLTALDKLLDSALYANVAQVGIRQNDDMRKIAAWVAIIAAPTMVAGIYGMNFEHMPELGSAYGYPIVLTAMALACLWLYRNFKRRDWL